MFCVKAVLNLSVPKFLAKYFQGLDLTALYTYTAGWS